MKASSATTVDGDLGAIDAGDPTRPASALKTLTVQSRRLLALTTQGGGGDLQSDFDRRLDKRNLAGAVKDAFANVTDSTGATGKIGAVFIGGSLLGSGERAGFAREKYDTFAIAFRSSA